MKLIKILLEQNERPKAIIIAGSGGAGKSTLLKNLDLQDIEMFNLDDFVEKQGFSMVNANINVDLQIRQAMVNRKNFVWQTTAGNADKIKSIVDAGYDVFMVMVYTHPFISFIQNFNREERKLPTPVVLSTWKNTYSLIDFYKNLLKDNFVLVVGTDQEEYKSEVEQFNNAARQGGESIEKFIKDYTASEPEKFTSTLSKPFSIEDREALAAYEKSIKGVDFNRDDKGMQKYLMKHFMGFWERGKMPPMGSMEKKKEAILKDRLKRKEEMKSTTDAISSTLLDPQFKQKLNSAISIDQVKSKIQNFISS